MFYLVSDKNGIIVKFMSVENISVLSKKLKINTRSLVT